MNRIKILLAVIMWACCPLFAHSEGNHRDSKAWSGVIMSRPMHIRLFTKPFPPLAIKQGRSGLRTKVGENIIFGSFGGIDPSVDYSELWFTVTWEVKGKKIVRSSQAWVLRPDLNSNEGVDKVEFAPSCTDESILVIISCGDSVIDRVALSIPRVGDT